MISLLCPTRKRPDDFIRLHTSVMDTAHNPNEVEIIAVVDLNDFSYLDLEGMRNVVWITAREGLVFSDLWNVAWRYASGDIFQLAADDEVFMTDGWDLVVRSAFDEYEDRILLVYGYCGEGVRQDAFGELPFISREWTDVVGRFVPGYYHHDYCDAHLNEVANRIGRQQKIDIVTEHIRRADGRAPHDETSLGIIERTMHLNSVPMWNTMVGEREKEAEKLRSVMK